MLCTKQLEMGKNLPTSSLFWNFAYHYYRSLNVDTTSRLQSCIKLATNTILRLNKYYYTKHFVLSTFQYTTITNIVRHLPCVHYSVIWLVELLAVYQLLQGEWRKQDLDTKTTSFAHQNECIINYTWIQKYILGLNRVP